MINEDDFDYFCQEPLANPDGSLNDAAIKELSNAIENMPPTHQRLSNEPEWAKKRLTHWREITAALGYWAIRQIPDWHKDKTGIHDVYVDISLPYAPDFQKIVGYLSYVIRKNFDEFGYAKLSLCDISKMLHDNLMAQNISIFDSWNTREEMNDYCLDLHALLHNVCLTIRAERRENDRFDAEFNKKYPDNKICCED